MCCNIKFSQYWRIIILYSMIVPILWSTFDIGLIIKPNAPNIIGRLISGPIQPIKCLYWIAQYTVVCTVWYRRLIGFIFLRLSAFESQTQSPIDKLLASNKHYCVLYVKATVFTVLTSHTVLWLLSLYLYCNGSTGKPALLWELAR